MVGDRVGQPAGLLSTTSTVDHVAASQPRNTLGNQSCSLPAFASLIHNLSRGLMCLLPFSAASTGFSVVLHFSLTSEHYPTSIFFLLSSFSYHHFPASHNALPPSLPSSIHTSIFILHRVSSHLRTLPMIEQHPHHQ